MSQLPTILSQDFLNILNGLYQEAEQSLNTAKGRKKPDTTNLTRKEKFEGLKHKYMQIDKNFGHLLYSLIRAKRPDVLVEFGTSYGISTLFLAVAAADNQCGQVVSTEFVEDKAQGAKTNLEKARLAHLVDVRVGDALETLSQPMPGPVDFVFLDGDKSLYLSILKLLEPQMAEGCIVVADNTEKADAQPFIDYIRDTQNGYVSSAIVSYGESINGSHHEVLIKL